MAITGAGGFLGSRLGESLSASASRLILWNRQESPLDSPAAWETAVKQADIIFHLAAQTSAAFANENPAQDYESNVAPALLLIEACKKLARKPVVIFSGTVTQCGMPQTNPVDETHPEHPITVYDVHKGEAEGHLLHASRQGILQAISLRLPNLYGPGKNSSAPDRGILNQIMRRALEGKEILVYGSGEYSRDFLFIDDAVAALIMAAACAQELSGNYFILSSGESITLLQAFCKAAQQAERLTGKPCTVKIDSSKPLQPIEQRNYAGNAARFSQTTRWRANTSIEEGIAKTLRYFQTNSLELAAFS